MKLNSDSHPTSPNQTLMLVTPDTDVQHLVKKVFIEVVLVCMMMSVRSEHANIFQTTKK